MDNINKFLAECGNDIKEELYQWSIDKILRGTVNNLARWYKDKLVEKQFDK